MYMDFGTSAEIVALFREWTVEVLRLTCFSVAFSHAEHTEQIINCCGIESGKMTKYSLLLPIDQLFESCLAEPVSFVRDWGVRVLRLELLLCLTWKWGVLMVSFPPPWVENLTLLEKCSVLEFPASAMQDTDGVGLLWCWRGKGSTKHVA